ncbi:hypothetical protein Tco_0358930 [Tanacetum coccineum]
MLVLLEERLLTEGVVKRKDKNDIMERAKIETEIYLIARTNGEEQRGTDSAKRMKKLRDSEDEERKDTRAYWS